MADQVFVFGSNLAGRHGKGAALTARNDYGAEYGVGIGPTGNAYAIPTKDWELKKLPLAAVKMAILHFIAYAEKNHDQRFYVTPVGTGLAGFTEDEIRSCFLNVPPNIQFAETWTTPPDNGDGQ